MASLLLLLISFVAICRLVTSSTPTMNEVPESSEKKDVPVIPQQMKQLYKQYKQGHAPIDGVNTIRYIQPIKGSITTSGHLLFSLDAIHKEETIMRSELHFYRRGDNWDIPLLVDFSEISPYYLMHIQREEVAPRSWGRMVIDATKTTLQCVNTLVTNHQIGVKFRLKSKDLEQLNMTGFLRHHTVPFLLIYSNDTRSLDMDQIKSRNRQTERTIVQEMNGMINPENGHISENTKEKRDIFDNELPGDPDIERRKTLDREMNAISNIRVPTFDDTEQHRSSIGDNSKVVEAANAMVSEPRPNNPIPETTVDILQPRHKSRQRKIRKNKGGQRLPWPEDRRPSKNDLHTGDRNNGVTFPTSWIDVKNMQPMSSLCSRKSLTINFADLGWGKRIIAPQSYNAYYCSGQCSFPFSLGLQPTNHATLQSLLNAINLRPDVPQPCCVPDKLSPVSLLFYDEQNNVVLKSYPGMTVDSCACR